MRTVASDARVHYPIHKQPAHQAPSPTIRWTWDTRRHRADQSPDPSKLNSVPTPPQQTRASRFHTPTPTQRARVRVVLRRPRPQGRSIIDDSTSEHHHTYQNRRLASGRVLLRKEVIQPHLPVRLPCYDFVPIASPTFDGSLPQGVRPPASGVADFRDVTGGVYKARERIHRSVADLRLLATPTSWGRVADPNPN